MPLTEIARLEKEIRELNARLERGPVSPRRAEVALSNTSAKPAALADGGLPQVPLTERERLEKEIRELNARLGRGPLVPWRAEAGLSNTEAKPVVRAQPAAPPRSERLWGRVKWENHAPVEKAVVRPRLRLLSMGLVGASWLVVIAIVIRALMGFWPASSQAPAGRPEAEAAVSDAEITAGASSLAQLPVFRARLRSGFGGIVESLEVEGEQPEFMPVAQLRWPKLTKVLKLHVLLYAQLDPFTERMWKLAGLLADDGGSAKAFVRQVTISKPEDLEYLYDWHVEAVAFASHRP